jgi:hypothetical protein
MATLLRFTMSLLMMRVPRSMLYRFTRAVESK